MLQHRYTCFGMPLCSLTQARQKLQSTKKNDNFIVTYKSNSASSNPFRRTAPPPNCFQYTVVS